MYLSLRCVAEPAVAEIKQGRPQVDFRKTSAVELSRDQSHNRTCRELLGRCRAQTKSLRPADGLVCEMRINFVKSCRLGYYQSQIGGSVLLLRGRKGSLSHRIICSDRLLAASFGASPMPTFGKRDVCFGGVCVPLPLFAKSVRFWKLPCQCFAWGSTIVVTPSLHRLGSLSC